MSKIELSNEVWDKYGEDLLDPTKCQAIYDEIKAKHDELETKLDLENASSTIGRAVKEGDETIEKATNLSSELTDVVSNITAHLSDVNQIRDELRTKVDDLHRAQTCLQLFKIIQKIDYLNKELQRQLKRKNDEQCATLFANLTEISRNLKNTPALHLRNHLKVCLHFWHNELKTKLAYDFNEALKAVKWPFLSTNYSVQRPSANQAKKLATIVEYLLQVELPSESVDPLRTSALLSDFPPLCLPIYLLVQPLRKRFMFHFYGTTKTNRLDKPEWYFTLVLNWVRDHVEFVVEWVQPIADKMGLHHIDAKLEFIRGLVQLTVEKLNMDYKSNQMDDFTFSHSIDEALGFEKEMRETYDYPTSQPSIFAVLTQAEYLNKWIVLEKKYAIEKMDEMFSSTTHDPFELLTDDIEDLKIPASADCFITLLQTITDRYESLPQPGHRLRFLDLQLELLDDHRVRLLQLAHAETENIVESLIPMIANSIFYVESCLIDWGATVHFLGLHYYREQAAAGQPTHELFDHDCDNVFGETLQLYRAMRKHLLTHLAEYVVVEARGLSRAYRGERWSALSVGREFRALSLTPSACTLLETLAKRLHQLQRALAAKLFAVVWRSVAEQLDAYLVENLVMDSRFSEGGGLQLKYDVVRNLLPLFSSYTNRPEAYFTQILECVILLNIAKGSALLLRETLVALEGATGVEDTRRITLKELGIVYFTPQMAVKILNQRTDITVNRLVVD